MRYKLEAQTPHARPQPFQTLRNHFPHATVAEHDPWPTITVFTDHCRRTWRCERPGLGAAAYCDRRWRCHWLCTNSYSCTCWSLICDHHGDTSHCIRVVGDPCRVGWEGRGGGAASLAMLRLLVLCWCWTCLDHLDSVDCHDPLVVFNVWTRQLQCKHE